MSDKLKIMQERLDGKNPNDDEPECKVEPQAEVQALQEGDFTSFREVRITVLPISSAS